MFGAENKENNAKSSTEDKSNSKTLVRRSVLKEFDPFYSSPQQKINKPTSINEGEEENLASNDTETKKQLETSKPEEPLLQVTASKFDFNDTIKTRVFDETFEASTQESTKFLNEHEIKEENLQQEHPESVKEVDEILENDYREVFTCKPNENCRVECKGESSLTGTTEKSTEYQTEPFSEYFECQKQNDIVFVNTQFDGTFDQTQNMEDLDPLGSSFINKTVDPLDQDSVYEECLDTTFPESSKMYSAEPKNEEIWEIINKSFEEALDGNDVEIEDNVISGGNSVENVASIDCAEANVEKNNVIFAADNVENSETIVHSEVQSIRNKDVEEGDNSFVIKDTDTQKKFEISHENAIFIIDEPETNGKNIAANVVIEEIDALAKENETQTCSFVNVAAAFAADVENSHKDQHQDDSLAVVSFEEIEISSGQNCEGTDNKSIVFEDQYKNASFLVEETEKSPISKVTEVESVQNVNETDCKAIDISQKVVSFEVNSDQNIQETDDKPIFEAKRTAFEEVCEQHQNTSFVDDETSQSFDIEEAEAESPAFEVQHKNVSFEEIRKILKDIISEAAEVESAQNIQGTDKAIDTTFEGKNETVKISHEDQPTDVSFVVEDAVQSPKEIRCEAVEAKRTDFEIPQHKNASFEIEESDKIGKDIISEATHVDSTQNITRTHDHPVKTSFKEKTEAVETTLEDQHKDVSFVVEEQITVDVSFEAVAKRTAFEKIQATEVESAQNIHGTDKAIDRTFEGKNETVEISHKDQPKDVSFVVEDAVQSPKEIQAVLAKKTAFDIPQHKNASFEIEESEKIVKDIISEETQVESAQNIKKTHDHSVEKSFKSKTEAVETTLEDQHEDVSSVVEEQSTVDVSFEAEARRTAFEKVQATEVESAQNIEETEDKPINTTFEEKTETVEISHEDQLTVIPFVSEAVQCSKDVSFEIVHDDQHENATFVTEETDNIPKDIVSQVTEAEFVQNINGTDDKPINTTFEAKNNFVETTYEDIFSDFQEQSPQDVSFEANRTTVEVVHVDQHGHDSSCVTEESRNKSKDIILEATEAQCAQSIEESDDKAMHTTFEAENKSVESTHEGQHQDVKGQSPKDVSFEAKRTTFEIAHVDQHEHDSSFVTEETPNNPNVITFKATEVESAQNIKGTDEKAMDTTFEGKNESVGSSSDDQPKDVSFVVGEAVQSPANASFVAEQTLKVPTDIISEATEVEFGTDDKKMDKTFKAENDAVEISTKDVSLVEEAVQVPNNVTSQATTAPAPKETDDEPLHINIKISNETISSSPENATFEEINVQEIDEPMETSFVVEVNSTKTYDEPMDITFEANDAQHKDASFIVEEVQKPQDVTFYETGGKFSQESNNKPLDTTFDANINPGASFVISDEHTAESTKYAEALAQSLDQTIDVEESAVVDDIDAIIDNLNETIQADQISEDQVQVKVENAIVQTVEVIGGIVEKPKEVEPVEDVKSDNAGSSNVLEVTERIEDSNKFASELIESAPKPKRLECRPNIRPLRNKTQVIDNPVIFQPAREAQALDGNLIFELNLLQTELKRIQEDNAKKDQRILVHAMNRGSTMESVRKYERIAKEYHNHVKKQSEELKLLRRKSNQVAANLTSTEMAFSVVFKNYEKAKSAIESFKKNEAMLLEEINKLEDKLSLVDLECKSVEDKCKEDMKLVQEQADQKKEAYKQNLNKLQATVKRLKIKASSLESSLQQKTEECQALATLCDDILKEKPSTVS